MIAVLLSLALILANGAFVAYEFALIAANRSQFEGDGAGRTSRAVRNGFSDLSMQLAGAQVGITVCSLVLGQVGEPVVAHFIEGFIEGSVSEEVTRAIGLVIALTIVSFLHLVVGEMIPKNIAISKPNVSLRWLVLPYQAYLALVRPFVLMLNWLAVVGVRLFGVEARDELKTSHTTAELATIVASAAETGSIDDESAELLHGALDFAERPVLEVASLLNDTASIRFGATSSQAERVVRSSGQTRLPVLAPARGQNRLVGYLHAKDLLAIDPEDRFRPIPERMVRPMVLVRAEQPVIEVLRMMRSRRRQLAVVISEDGPVAVVSVEQIIRALIASNTVADV